jgi:hypothetical protein
MSKTRHCCLDVKGALMNWEDEKFLNCVTDDNGNMLTPAQVKSAFLDELGKGHLVIPLGEPCEGFDYSGGGCPGHEIDDEPSEAVAA